MSTHQIILDLPNPDTITQRLDELDKEASYLRRLLRLIHQRPNHIDTLREAQEGASHA